MTRRAAVRSVVALLALSFVPSASAQESKSAVVAKQLAAAMDAAKLDSIAARDPSAPDVFIAALYFPGAQLLVVSAKYTVPQLLNERLTKKEFRDIYIDLNSASVPASKVFIQDASADGFKTKNADNQAADTYEIGGKMVLFNGDWKAQKLSEQDYQKEFSGADEKYRQMLSALLAQVKKPS